jgi:hypothetical protein
MMDDVVGLVMVQVISNLGGENFSAVTVIRPILVSIAFAVVVPIACLFILKPVTLWLNRYRESHPTAAINDVMRRTQTAFVFDTALLIALIAGATYAGTSNLFAAYIAGATISWWDSELPHAVLKTDERSNPTKERDRAATSSSTDSSDAIAGPSKRKDATNPGKLDERAEQSQSHQEADRHEKADQLCGAAIYEQYYHQAVSKILQPLFFASIGFSIPITRMFRGAIVWRGIVYTVLMAFAKLVCGLWLIRLSVIPMKGAMSRLNKRIGIPSIPHLWGKRQTNTSPSQATAATAPPAEPRTAEVPTRINAPSTPANSSERRSSPNPPKPLSIHPPLILALAMCARGEIGFLISGVAESNGIFSPSGVTSSEPSDIFLVVTWAIVLCTIIGPLGVGLSVRRVKKLQERKNKQQEGAGKDVLGVWGVE